jgi:hypothetical protein
MGETGSGKTDSLLTVIEAGLELFVLVTEPTGAESLIDSCERRKLDISKLHYAIVPPTARTIDALLAQATLVASNDFEGLAKLKPVGNRRDSQWFKMLHNIKNFHCDLTDKDFGDVTTWDDSRCIAIDSLSGISIMAADLVKGDKPSMHQGEWGAGMSMIETLCHTLSSSQKCMYIMTSHMDREPNELTGGTQITVSTMGRKLAPKLPRFFSEVIMSYQSNGKFLWKTSDPSAALKKRALPLGSDLAPSFVPIIEAHRRRLKTTAEQRAQAGTV